MGFAIADVFMNGNNPDPGVQAQNTEAARQKAITTGKGSINKVFAGFNPQFYQNRVNAYENFAMPQLADQYRQTRDQIGFGLANKGLTRSGAAGKQWSDLFRTNATAKQGVVDSAIGQANDLQKQVATQKEGIINQLYQTADPGAAGQAANSAVASLTQPSVFAPLANQFSNLVNQYYLASILNQKSPTIAPAMGSSQSQFAPIPS